VGHDGAQVGLGTGGNVIWGASVEHAVPKLAIVIPNRTISINVLGLLQLNELAVALGLEQVTVLSGLLEKGGVNGIALLKNLLRGAVLVDQAGDEGLGAGFLAGGADAVEDVRGGNGAGGDVETALLSSKLCVSKQLHTIEDPSELAEFVVESSGSASGGGAYAEALVHGLGVGGVGAKPTRRLAHQQPRRSSRASGGEHG
jgi:hypothetical protein